MPPANNTPPLNPPPHAQTCPPPPSPRLMQLSVAALLPRTLLAVALTVMALLADLLRSALELLSFLLSLPLLVPQPWGSSSCHVRGLSCAFASLSFGHIFFMIHLAQSVLLRLQLDRGSGGGQHSSSSSTALCSFMARSATKVRGVAPR